MGWVQLRTLAQFICLETELMGSRTIGNSDILELIPVPLL